MGSGASVEEGPVAQIKRRKVIKEESIKVLVARFSPPWAFSQPCLSDRMRQNCRNSLNRLLNGSSQGCRLAQAENDTVLPLPYFSDLFFSCLFDIEPSCRDLFASVNIRKQGAMLFRTFRAVISMSNSNVNTKHHPKLVKLINRHTFEYHVHPVYYSYFFDAMVQTLRTAFRDEFTRELEYSWVSMISSLIKLVLPIAVEGWAICAREQHRTAKAAAARRRWTPASGVQLAGDGFEQDPHEQQQSPQVPPPPTGGSSHGGFTRRWDYRCIGSGRSSCFKRDETLFDHQAKWASLLRGSSCHALFDDEDANESEGEGDQVNDTVVGRSRGRLFAGGFLGTLPGSLLPGKIGLKKEQAADIKYHQPPPTHHHHNVRFNPTPHNAEESSFTGLWEEEEERRRTGDEAKQKGVFSAAEPYLMTDSGTVIHPREEQCGPRGGDTESVTPPKIPALCTADLSQRSDAHAKGGGLSLLNTHCAPSSIEELWKRSRQSNRATAKGENCSIPQRCHSSPYHSESLFDSIQSQRFLMVGYKQQPQSRCITTSSSIDETVGHDEKKGDDNEKQTL
mmetsp:Transcript_9024/g.14736  ORF Transcript_9024/g.14736 Transcript_9024/m.14736 type:complete len:564 (-) Transcript_9024:169-1860(-)